MESATRWIGTKQTTHMEKENKMKIVSDKLRSTISTGSRRKSIIKYSNKEKLHQENDIWGLDYFASHCLLVNRNMSVDRAAGSGSQSTKSNDDSSLLHVIANKPKYMVSLCNVVLFKSLLNKGQSFLSSNRLKGQGFLTWKRLDRTKKKGFHYFKSSSSTKIKSLLISHRLRVYSLEIVWMEQKEQFSNRPCLTK